MIEYFDALHYLFGMHLLYTQCVISDFGTVKLDGKTKASNGLVSIEHIFIAGKK